MACRPPGVGHSAGGKAASGQGTRTCHYCKKSGHLQAACKKKRGAKPELGSPTAALTATSKPATEPAPTAKASVGALRAQSPDYADAAAMVAQQTLAGRRAKVPLDVSALTLSDVPVATCYDWPDTDDEQCVCPLLEDGCVASLHSSQDVWALCDTGSSLITCPADLFPCTLR